jgi:hypothetical protein
VNESIYESGGRDLRVEVSGKNGTRVNSMIEPVLSIVRKCARDPNCPFWAESKGKEGKGQGKENNSSIPNRGNCPKPISIHGWNMVFGSAFGSVFGSSHEEGKELIVVRSDQELVIVYDQKSADIRDLGIMQNIRERHRRERNEGRVFGNKREEIRKLTEVLHY